MGPVALAIPAIIGAAATVYSSVQSAKMAKKSFALQQQQASDLKNALASQPQPTMPQPTGQATEAAKRLSLEEQMRRRGRAASILTDTAGSSDVLGS